MADGDERQPRGGVRLTDDHAPLIRLLGACASSEDAAAQAACRWLWPLDGLADEMVAAATDGVWSALASVLLHAHLRPCAHLTAASARILRRASTLKAVWSCEARIRALIRGDGDGTQQQQQQQPSPPLPQQPSLSRLILPCVQAYLGGGDGGLSPRRAAACATAPQRALLSALHAALLALTRHHVDIGLPGARRP